MPATDRSRPRVRLRRAEGMALGWLHVLPDFLIIGAARAGTTALMSALRTHPNVMPGPRRELHFFDTDHRNFGLGWYRRRFPSRLRATATELAGRRPAICGENSPYYLAHPAAPGRIRAALPDVRLVALLRDPTDRAVSHWRMRTAMGLEDQPFEALVDAELAALTRSEPAPAPAPTMHRARRYGAYVERGLYLPQLERWHAAFPREQLLIVPSERWFRDPMAVLVDVWAHLGVPARRRLPAMNRNRRGKDLPVDRTVVERLRDFYRPRNAALAAYLDRPLGWDEPAQEPAAAGVT